VSLSFIQSKQAGNNHSDTINNNIDMVTKEVESPPADIIDCSTTNDTIIGPPVQTTPSSSNDIPSSNNQISSIENPTSSSLLCSNSISSNPKTALIWKPTYKAAPSKNLATGQKLSKM
jgi:hypothetical protein